MTEPVEITAEMVMAVATTRRGRAEHIATYVNHRLAGLGTLDAAREAGISETSSTYYERVLPALCSRYGLSEPTKRAEIPPNYYIEASDRARHLRWHEARGTTKPDCPLCQGGA